jgi:hypothetical protein
MNQKIAIALILFSSLIILTSCNTKKSEYRKIIGQEYYSLREFKPFINFQEVGGSFINRNESVAFTINHYQSGVINIIAFEKIADESQRRVKYSLLDILEISDLKQNQEIAYGNCRLNGKSDQEILAIYEASDQDVEYFTQILKAWRANTKTRKIEEISIKGIDCENEVYGVE